MHLASGKGLVNFVKLLASKKNAKDRHTLAAEAARTNYSEIVSLLGDLATATRANNEAQML